MWALSGPPGRARMRTYGPARRTRICCWSRWWLNSNGTKWNYLSSACPCCAVLAWSASALEAAVSLLLLTHTSRYGAHKETAASKALALQAKAAQHGQALLK